MPNKPSEPMTPEAFNTYSSEVKDDEYAHCYSRLQAAEKELAWREVNDSTEHYTTEIAKAEGQVQIRDGEIMILKAKLKAAERVVEAIRPIVTTYMNGKTFIDHINKARKALAAYDKGGNE
jgi:hypothetical protein